MSLDILIQYNVLGGIVRSGWHYIVDCRWNFIIRYEAPAMLNILLPFQSPCIVVVRPFSSGCRNIILLDSPSYFREKLLLKLFGS